MRWPEVMLVVVIQAAMAMFFSESSVMFETMSTNENAHIPYWAGFLVGFGSVLCGIVLAMLYLGFLKTSAVEGVHPQQPMDLLRQGRPYFWKMLLFQILLLCALWILSSILVIILAGLIWKTQDATNIPEWFLSVCVLVTIVFMMKPALFIPARIIVYNDSVMQAILAMRQYRIKDVDCLYKLIAGLVGIMGIFMFLFTFVAEKTIVHYVLSGIAYLILNLVSLWLMLTVVLWVQGHLEALQAQVREGQSEE